MKIKYDLSAVKSLVVTGFGINCEEETVAAYKLAGSTVRLAHLNDIFSGSISIQEFDILTIPGGFSFGDDISSGKVLANKIRFKKLPDGSTLLEQMKQFIADKKFILGICNGFQVLVKLGLLPDLGGDAIQEVSLQQNDSGKFENRWIFMRVNSKSESPFLQDLEVIPVPVRHGEGKIIVRDKKVEVKMLTTHQMCLTYCDNNGRPARGYPNNPNGSTLDCAGLTDRSRQVLGLMPHPEAYLSIYNHPNWRQILREKPDYPKEGLGLQIFKNIVTHIAKRIPQMQ